ncbi:MAG: hypothetical protein PHS46_08065 [Candidatus Omnitrophica bacterium]|nr:hypothetical protein [Candidatus Omnitrophota bacterium]
MKGIRIRSCLECMFRNSRSGHSCHKIMQRLHDDSDISRHRVAFTAFIEGFIEEEPERVEEALYSKCPLEDWGA